MFDTLQYTKGAEKVGIRREHAEYQAEQLLKLVNDELATKKDIHEIRKDIKQLEVDLRKDIKQLDVDLRKDIEEIRKDIKETEYKLTIRLGIMMFISMGLVVTVLSFILKH